MYTEPAAWVHALDVRLVDKLIDLVLVCAEHILVATAEVSMDLTGQERIFRYVRSARVIVEWKKEEPNNADNDAERGEVRRELENARVSPQAQRAGCNGLSEPACDSQLGDALT